MQFTRGHWRLYQVTMIGPRVMRKINREQRGVMLTDVLSFPARDMREVTENRWILAKHSHRMIAPFLGELVISPDRAAEQAKASTYARSRVDVFTVHGILHLLGYDHE